MRYVIDSFAWLEYFMGTAAGRKVASVIGSETDEKITPSICLAEVSFEITEMAGEVRLRSSIVELKRVYYTPLRYVSTGLSALAVIVHT